MEAGVTIECPYCGEPTWVTVDAGGASRQRFVSDCEVCCRPIHATASLDPHGSTVVRGATEDEPG